MRAGKDNSEIIIQDCCTQSTVSRNKLLYISFSGISTNGCKKSVLSAASPQETNCISASDVIAIAGLHIWYRKYDSQLIHRINYHVC